MSKAILNLEIIRGTNFGPIQITCKNAAGRIVPLAGWSAFAEARDNHQSAVIVNLNPVISANDTAGLVTLSEIGWATTKALVCKSIEWDLILQNPDGKRLPPILGGKLNIVNPITQPE